MMQTRTFIPILLATAALACSPYEDDGDTASAGHVTYQQELTRICGADRYTGVQGADVSRYQENFNWERQKNAGMVFGIARISDGTQYIDQYFDRNWSELKRLGMIRGSYQYFRPAQNVQAQADIVINKLGRLGPGDLPAVIDVESNGGLNKAQVTAKVKQWVDLVEAGTGKKPIIYTGPYFWQDNVGDTGMGDHPLWIAHYGTTCPLTPDGWSKWSFWQYCDGNTAYCENGQGFDRNVFNGTLEELQELAGLKTDYAAEYVDQSFPLAVESIPLVPNQTFTGYIELRNTGEQAWDENTRLGTTEPRDRPSPLADPTWLAPNRPAAVSGMVEPGETYKFEFTLRAPAEPGEYAEYFGVVQEGVAWFSDDGQGGPPDNQLQVKVEVSLAPYGAELVDMSFNDMVNLEVGGSEAGWVEVRNSGSATWADGEVLLAVTPRESESPLAHQSWVSASRVVANVGEVAPGESYRFEFVLAGNQEGTLTQTFGLVTADGTWFSEAPTGGGPTDDAIAIDVLVGDEGATTGGPRTGETDEGLPPLVSTNIHARSGGCTQAGTVNSKATLLVGLLMLVGLVRRRHRIVT